MTAKTYLTWSWLGLTRPLQTSYSFSSLKMAGRIPLTRTKLVGESYKVIDLGKNLKTVILHRIL